MQIAQARDAQAKQMRRALRIHHAAAVDVIAGGAEFADCAIDILLADHSRASVRRPMFSVRIVVGLPVFGCVKVRAEESILESVSSMVFEPPGADERVR